MEDINQILLASLIILLLIRTSIWKYKIRVKGFRTTDVDKFLELLGFLTLSFNGQILLFYFEEQQEVKLSKRQEKNEIIISCEITILNEEVKRKLCVILSSNKIIFHEIIDEKITQINFCLNDNVKLRDILYECFSKKEMSDTKMKFQYRFLEKSILI